MIDLIWDIFQQGDISHAKHKNRIQDEKLKGNRFEIDQLAERLQSLERRHEQLKLVTLSLWSLLRDHSGLMEYDLRKYIEKVDLMDGARDGKIGAKEQRTNCKGCDRIILNTAVICVYCGTYSDANPYNHT